jgi:cardiolipin synthase A/B
MPTWWPIVASHFLSILGFGMALLLAGDVLRDRRAPGTTFAWLLAIALVPYLGVPLYLVFGGRKLKQMAGKKGRLYPDADGRSAGDPCALVRPGATEMERMLCSFGAPPMREGNHVALLVTGEAAYAAILAAIDGATRRIEIATLILSGDEVGSAVVEHLVAKAKAGVEVRVLVDALFAFESSRAKLAALTRAGGKVAWFMPLLHVPFRGHANLRLHRKMVLVDDRLAVVGGMNLAREYMGPTPLPGRWVDLSMTVTGPAVDDLAAVFRSDWAFASGERLGVLPAGEGSAAPRPADDGAGEALQVVASGPDASSDRIYDALLTGIFRAEKRLYVATPYFIPDDALDRALTLAARRGVDVRVLVPAQSNHRLADVAGASHLRLLADAGAKVQLYLPGMLHAKVVILDDDLALVGSANMDMRSLFLDYEVALACTARPRVAELAKWFEDLSQGSGALVLAGRAREVVESVARLVGPLV